MVGRRCVVITFGLSKGPIIDPVLRNAANSVSGALPDAIASDKGTLFLWYR
ncbi:hypothetical protein [Tanticharoenia sakaeratensis]|uniref:Uncharacterized protein n=1 Tax=Tanticharoenia sakaeratensis NBRC 103193 TaxID=1231623 RepID=A0A0D6MNS4_9PROT|nr:hypothetical protein [Tanticharoenia sakaeratensis]GAN54938.1 hypothetical protein Tasa_034_022 [Tanticharoenia sakaeratensis NBRC 103193]GBQ22526.1 hypothetical protein AA103193_2097 [Tanticharoenia sakaeratensis NBRC 103193]